VLAAALVLAGAAACGDGDAGRAGWWRPSAGVTWQWQLQGRLDDRPDVDVADVDPRVVGAAGVRRLRDEGRRVVCYFSAGSVEAFRGDPALPPAVVGRPLAGYPDERWLDVRRAEVRSRVVTELDRARADGCDGVEPDNVDAYANPSGFPLTAADQLAFNRFVAREAHRRGLAVGLKNDLDQVPALVGDFDFAVNEQCHEYDECAALRPFVAAGKPVLNAEYAARFRRSPEALCISARREGLSTLVLPVALDGSFRRAC
jgi:hypothetical protein